MMTRMGPSKPIGALNLYSATGEFAPTELELVSLLIKEGEEMIKMKGQPAVLDAGLIAAAQRVEHYEIAGYGTVRAWAQQLGYDRHVELLTESLDEEGEADKTLSQLAEIEWRTKLVDVERDGD